MGRGGGGGVCGCVCASVFGFNRGYVLVFTQVIGDTPPNGDIPNF